MPPTNILWITCDEMKASALSVYGNDLVSMPASERLASEGVTFRQAFCQIGKCIPVRSTFLTGRYPHVDGMRTMSRADFSEGNFTLLSRDDPSLLTWLREENPAVRHDGASRGAGYRFAIAGKNHVTDPQTARELFEPLPPLRRPVEPAFHNPGDLFERAYFAGRVRDDYDRESFRDTIAVDRMIRFLEQRRDRAPFLALLDIGEPHPVYKEWPGLLDDLPLNEIPLPPRVAIEEAPGPQRAWRESHDIEELTDDQRRRIIRAYWTQCVFADRLVGRVLDALDRLDLTENTLVVFSSDHGDFAGEHGCFEKWDTVFLDAIVRVPLILRLPGRLPPGRSVDALTEMIDVPATIVDLLARKHPPTLQGRSLLPLLDGRTATHKEAVFAQGGVEPRAVANPGRNYREKLAKPYWGKQRTLIEHPDALSRAHMVRTRRHKLVYRLLGSHELYDLCRDPWELSNVYGQPEYADTVRELEGRLLHFLVEHEQDRPAIRELWA